MMATTFGPNISWIATSSPRGCMRPKPERGGPPIGARWLTVKVAAIVPMNSIVGVAVQRRARRNVARHRLKNALPEHSVIRRQLSGDWLLIRPKGRVMDAQGRDDPVIQSSTLEDDMAASYDCDFIEQSALMAAMSDDGEGLLRLLRSMLPGERWALRNSCWSVVRAIDSLT